MLVCDREAPAEAVSFSAHVPLLLAPLSAPRPETDSAGQSADVAPASPQQHCPGAAPADELGPCSDLEALHHINARKRATLFSKQFTFIDNDKKIF